MKLWTVSYKECCFLVPLKSLDACAIAEASPMVLLKESWFAIFVFTTFSVDPLTVTTTFLSFVIFWRLLNGRFDFFLLLLLLLLLLLFSKNPLFLFLCFYLLFKDIFEETPDKDRFVGDVMFWKFFEDIDANRIYHTNSVEYRTHWSWCSLRGTKSCVNSKCSVLFSPLFVFFVDVFYFLVCLSAGIWRWCSSKLSSTWCYCIFAWQICGLKVLLQSQVRRALHGARVPATQGFSHSLCLQLAIAGQGFFFLKAELGGHPWKMCRSPWPKYLEMTRMSLRAALNSWTTGEVAILMAIAAFRRLEFYLGGY